MDFSLSNLNHMDEIVPVRKRWAEKIKSHFTLSKASRKPKEITASFYSKNYDRKNLEVRWYPFYNLFDTQQI